MNEITLCAKMRGAFVFGGLCHHDGQPIFLSDDLALDQATISIAGGDPAFLVKGQAR